MHATPDATIEPDAVPNAQLDAPPPSCAALETAQARNGVCHRNADCMTGLLCAHTTPSGRYPGTCQRPGALATPCIETSECDAPSRCVTVTDQLHQCSDGSLGAPCGRSAGCASNHCVAFTCTSGLIAESCATDADCDQGYCAPRPDSSDEAPSFACTAGIRSEACLEDAQCRDGFCVAEPSAWGECQPGGIGQPCLDGADCQAGQCSGVGAGSFGSCTDNAIHSPCESDAACTSRICVEEKPGMGACSTGEQGMQCIEASDCLSGNCVLQPGMGLPGSCEP